MADWEILSCWSHVQTLVPLIKDCRRKCRVISQREDLREMFVHLHLQAGDEDLRLHGSRKDTVPPEQYQLHNICLP